MKRALFQTQLSFKSKKQATEGHAISVPKSGQEAVPTVNLENEAQIPGVPAKQTQGLYNTSLSNSFLETYFREFFKIFGGLCPQRVCSFIYNLIII